MKEPYNWDEYAPYYFPKAEELSTRAAEAEKAGEKEKAAELYVYVWIVDSWCSRIHVSQAEFRCLADFTISHSARREAKVCVEDGQGGLSQGPSVSSPRFANLGCS
jgi:hypothetical protein